MMATATGRQSKTDYPPEHRMNSGSGGKYRTGGSKTEESAEESAEWEEEDMEYSASEEEAATSMGVGYARRPLTATAGATRERGVDSRPGGAAAGRGDTCEATSAAADEAGAGGRHGAKTAARERVAGRRENPSGESYIVGVVEEGHEACGVATEPSGVRGDRGGREAYGVADHLGGYHQGVRGGIESPQGINNPGVDVLPRGDETSGLDTAGEGVLGEGGRGWGAMETPPPPKRPRREALAAVMARGWSG